MIVDSSSGLLKISAPNVTSETMFPFYISSAISGASTPVLKLIKITIVKWTVVNWIKCLGQSSSVWQTWSSGYSLNSGTWATLTPQNSSTSNTNNTTEQSTTSKALGTSIQSINGGTAAMVAASSILNTSSLSSLWWVFNQMQLFLLLMLSGVYLPIDVKNIITGLKFALSPLDYIPFKNVKIYSMTVEVFDFNLSNVDLEPLGLVSDSSIFNSFSLVLTILHMIPIHFIVICLRRVMKRCNPNKRCSFTGISKCIIEKCFIILTFGYYIRLLLEMNQLMLISSISEIRELNSSNKFRIISLSVAAIILIILLSMIGFVVYLSISFTNISNDKSSKLKEVFSGIREHKKFRFYIVILLLRRLAFVTILIFFTIILFV